MKYLSAEELLFFHHRLLIELQPDNDQFLTLNYPGLEAAVSRPKQTMNGVDLYPDVYSKASVLMQSLLENHPFLDGNKRVGVTAACIFMLINGYKINADNFEIFKVAMAVGIGEWKFQELKSWFEEHFAKTS